MHRAVLLAQVGLAALPAAPGLAQRLDLIVAEAEAAVDPYTGLDMLLVRLAPASSKALAAFTRDNVSRDVDLHIDGEHIMTVIVAGPIEDGAVQIASSSLERAALEDLARRLAEQTSRVWMVVRE